MSRVEMPGICYCSCHAPGSMTMHCVPCCARCPVCKKNIKWGIDDHVEECQARFDKLVAEAQRTSSSP
jgi:hypothetical protein